MPILLSKVFPQKNITCSPPFCRVSKLKKNELNESSSAESKGKNGSIENEDLENEDFKNEDLENEMYGSTFLSKIFRYGFL